MFEMVFYFLLTPLFFYPLFMIYANIMQSGHYEISKYLKYLKSNLSVKKIIYKLIYLTILFFLVLNLSTFLDNHLLIILMYVTFSFFLYKKKIKSKIKITSRIKRIIIFNFLALQIIQSILFLNIDYFVSNYLLLFNIIYFSYPFFFLLSFVFALPLERIIRLSYIIKAKKKLKENKELVVIGISGSYGKTSTKNIIYDLLSPFYNTYKTPKSFNTQMGITRSINSDEFDNNVKYFLCEYGIDKKGGMDKLLKIVKPHHTILTSIGPQHLLTFKKIENIVEEKLKLAKVVNPNNYVIINNDNTYLYKEKDFLKSHIITYGIYQNADIMAKNLEISDKGSLFDLYINNQNEGRFCISLLGEQNVLNTLGAIGVCLCLGVSFSKIKNAISNIKSIEHRLQLKKIRNINLIDDSFNSNEEGFKYACDILGLMKGLRIIITPGIIEQGENNFIINQRLGQYLASKVDLVYLVTKNAIPLESGLLLEGFENERIKRFDNFKSAWDEVSKMQGEVNVLLENDLPDIYLS